ncbi:MAG: hypothetical protein NXI32_20980 [bacterium]|nr:hypothetical protein [bacterium]
MSSIPSAVAAHNPTSSTEHPSKPGRLKRRLLYCLIGSVIFGAVLGIIIVLRDTWGWFEARVLLTTATIAIASLAGLACDLSRTPRGYNLLPKAGLGMSLISAFMVLALIWFEPLEETWYIKSTACVSIFAVATVHMCLLSISKLTGYFRWVYYVSWQIVFGLATLLAAMVIWQLDNPQVIRLVIVVSILDAAVSLIIPLLHRVCKTTAPAKEMLSPLEARNLLAVDAEISSLTKRLAQLQKLRGQLINETDSLSTGRQDR